MPKHSSDRPLALSPADGINKSKGKAERHPIVVPPLGESVHQATIVTWLKPEGAWISGDDPVVEIETEKVTLEIYAPVSGYVTQHKAKAGESVNAGEIIGFMEACDEQETGENSDGDTDSTGTDQSGNQPPLFQRTQTRAPLPHLRQRIAQRLKQAQNSAAILTTFNEVDMSAVVALRQRHQKDFVARYGIKLNYLSFFVQASVRALQEQPLLNSFIEDQQIITPNYQDISVAVSTDEGLVAPVIHNCHLLDLAQIEAKIQDYAHRVRKGQIQPDEMQGGTFTVTNGGVYGSLWSTPILNLPQSAILGLHKIEDRPVVRDQQIVIRPMMYIALSYDHRLIDGQQAVQFLGRIKEIMETPEMQDPES